MLYIFHWSKNGFITNKILRHILVTLDTFEVYTRTKAAYLMFYYIGTCHPQPHLQPTAQMVHCGWGSIRSCAMAGGQLSCGERITQHSLGKREPEY